MMTNEDKSTLTEEQQQIEDERFRTFRHLLINTSSAAICLPLDVIDRQDTETIRIVLGQLQRALDRRGIKPAEQFVQFDNVDAKPLAVIHSSAGERN